MLSKISKKYLQVYTRAPSTYTSLLAPLYGNAAYHTSAKAAKTNSLFSQSQRMFNTQDAAEGQTSSHKFRGVKGEELRDQEPRQPRREGAKRSESNQSRGFDNQIDFEAQIKDVAGKLHEKNLSVQEVSTSLRFASRSLSLQPGDSVRRKLLSTEEFRKNLNIIGQEADKVINQITPQYLSDFTNFLNVLRFNHADNFINNKLKSSLVRRVNDIFSKEEFKEEVQKLSFEQVAKILGDMVHFGYSIHAARRAGDMLEKGEHLKNLNTIVKLLDSLYASNTGIESLDFFLRKTEHYLQKPEIFSQLTTQQQVRLLRAFSEASYLNLVDYTIQSKLCAALEEKLHEFEETDVLILLRTYAHLSPEVAYSGRLFSKLNKTVVETAVQRQDEVSISFLTQYLATFFNNPINRDLPRESYKQLEQILEDKVTKADSYKLSPAQTMNLAKISIRNKGESKAFIETLVRGAKNNSKQLSYDDWNQISYALKNADKNVVLELEAHMVSGMKDERLKNPIILAENIMKIDNMKSRDELKDFQGELLQKCSESMSKAFIMKEDLKNVILNFHKINKPSEASQEVVKLIADTKFTEDQIQQWNTMQLQDLHLALSVPSSKNLYLRQKLLPIINERLKGMSVAILHNYIKKIVNTEELNGAQIRNLLDFFIEQENIPKVGHSYIYQLSEHLFRKGYSSSIRQDSNLQQFETNRIPSLIHNLYNKLNPEGAYINTKFLQNIHFFQVVADEIPSYFKKVVKKVLIDHKSYSQRQVVLAFTVAMQHSNLNMQLITALQDYFTNTFSLDEYIKLIHIQTNDMVYVNYLLKSAKLIQRFQIRNKITVNFVADTQLQTIVDQVVERAQKEIEKGRGMNVLNLLGGVSSYNDQYFNYEKNEKEVFALIKEGYKATNVRQALQGFVNIDTTDTTYQNTKLSLKLLREFSNLYKDEFNKLNPNQLVKVIEKYAKTKWMISDTYNSLIKAFSENFENFTPKQLAQFSDHLSFAGLRQEDIYSEVVNQVQESMTKQADKQFKHFSQFTQVSIPLFFAFTRTGLTDTTGFKKLVDDEFNRNNIGGKKTFFEHAADAHEREELLLQIFSNNLDKQDSRFKDLAEKLIESINNQKYIEYTDQTLKVYQALNLNPSPFSTKLTFNEKMIQQLERNFKHEQDQFKGRKQSNLYVSSNLQPALEQLGYNDLQFRQQLGDNFVADFYSPQHNTVFLTLDSETLCYDRIHPNWFHNYKLRLAEHLPNQPKVVVVNVFDLHAKAGELKDKVAHLEKSGVPSVAAATA